MEDFDHDMVRWRESPQKVSIAFDNGIIKRKQLPFIALFNQEVDREMDLQESIRLLLRDKAPMPSSDDLVDAVKDQSRLCSKMLQKIQRLSPLPHSDDEQEDDSSSGDDDDDDEDANFLKTRRTTRDSFSSSTKKTPNLRSLLGNLSLDEISRFTNYLTNGMTERHDAEAFLPATQDEAANAAAMDGPAAQKLPRQALQSAQLFVELLQRPGGWGAGFVQASALTALTALLKRWRVEIQDTVTAKASSRKKKQGNPNVTKSPRGSKRSRGKSVAFQNQDSSDDEQVVIVESDDDHDMEAQTSKLTPQELLMSGLNLCVEVARLPLHTEFLSWSSECREAVIEAVCSILGTTAAMTAPSKRTSVDPSAVFIAERVLRLAKKSLAECLVSGSNAEEDRHEPSPGRLSVLHETFVCIARGLYQMLTWKEILPFGESGKQAASNASWVVLGNLNEELSDIFPTHETRIPSNPIEPLGGNEDDIASPGRSTPTLSNVTPKPNRRIRLSISGSARKETLSITSPKLKSTARRKSAPTAWKNKNRPIFSAMLGLLQKIVTDSAMEKASVRNSAIETIQKCTGTLSFRERRQFLQFLIQACHSRVPVHRLVTSEIIGKILSEVWLWTDHARQNLPSPPNSGRSRKSLSPLVNASEKDMPTALFGALQGRLTDRVPTVRAASIFALSGVLKAARETKAKSGGASICSLGISEILATEVDELLEVLRVRASVDVRATVRRYAIMTLGEVFLWSATELTEYDLALLRDRCQDPSTITRKAAAAALTALVEAGDSHVTESLQHTWISAVVPLCLDSESSCANNCVEFAQRLMLRPLLDRNDTVAIDRAWSILAKVGDGTGRQGTAHNEPEALRLAVMKMIENSDEPGSVKLDLMLLIYQVATATTDDSHNTPSSSATETRRNGIWCLFDAFVRSFRDTSSLLQLFRRKSVDVSFLAMAWHSMLALSTKEDVGPQSRRRLRGCVRKALYVMATAARALDETAVMEARDRLKGMLCHLELPEDVVGSAVSALSSTTLALSTVGDVTAAHAACKLWISEALDSCEAKLTQTIGNCVSQEELNLVSRALYTIGDCSMVGFNSNDDGPTSKRDAASLSARDFQAKGFVGVHVKPSGALVDLVLSFLSDSFPGTSAVPIPENVRAHAFLTLGKLCLRDVNLAKRALNVLARELHENMSKGSSVIQSNVLLIMGDLCIKFTNLADRYLPVMAACLQSGTVDITSNVLESPGNNGFEVVRKSAVVLLSSLIMQDYIKWRGLLFHRFLVAAADEHEDVASMAVSALSGPLLIKTPKLFFNHFVESFFVLNRCTAHPIYVTAASTGDGGSGIAVGFDGIDLSGEAGRVRRMKMYELMLSKMSDEEKIGATAKLAKEVLGSALVEGSDLHKACSKALKSTDATTAYLVLNDALVVLRSDSMRVGKKATSESEDIEDPTVDGTAKRVVEAKKHLIKTISRKHLIEIVVPILCNLRALLQKNLSPLLREVMGYMVDLYSLYKNEFQEVMMNELTLLQEIEYDARQSVKAKSKPLLVSRPGMHTPMTSFLAT